MEATMGGLIQTKGTQRLARLFNNRFDDNATGIGLARNLASTAGPGPLPDAFAANVNLDVISDNFIAQHATFGAWIADLNDVLYPSATLTASGPTVGTNVLNFTLPAGYAFPLTANSAIAPHSTVCNLAVKNTIPTGTFVGAVTPGAGRNFTVTLVDKNAANVNVTVAQNDMINFATGKHQRLVRRWRWYLQHDLTSENHQAIRLAISNALNDTSFIKITFQTVEDKQHVVVTPLSKLDNSDELSNDMVMHILLLTQSTTAPDKLDPQ
jgi:hypothetical protein